MRKNLIWALAILLISTHIIPPNHVSFAQESNVENECNIFDFSIDTIKVTDEKFVGQAEANQLFEIEFVRQNEIKEITSESNGKLEYKFEEGYIEENDKIIITNDHHKIETTVAGENEVNETIESDEHVECIVEEETVEAELTEEEPTSEEQAEETAEEEIDNLKEVVEKDIPSEAETVQEAMPSDKAVALATETTEEVSPATDDMIKEENTEDGINYQTSNEKSVNELNEQSYVYNLEVAIEMADNKIIVKGQVSGYNGAPGGIEIIVKEESGEVIKRVEKIEKSGYFQFEIDMNDFKGDRLTFQAVQNKVQTSKPVTKKIQKKVLELKVPSAIEFEDTVISSSKKIIHRKAEDLKVEVKSNGSKDGWKLLIKANPLSNGHHTIDKAIYFVEDDTWKSVENESLEIASSSTVESDHDIHNLNWHSDEGILLKLNPIQAQTDSEYSTIIEWTLTDGP